MITCRNAKNLFDRHLDGELPPSLQTELHAHLLNCCDCQGELTLLEACGDVIAYDRCEPAVSASFTDRVLAAHRATARPAARRNWTRLVVTVASPLAAAACITLAVMLTAPAGKARPTMVAGAKQKVTDQQMQILDRSGKHITQSDELANTPAMPAGFVDAVAGPIVEQTKTAVAGTRRSIEQLDSLLQLGFAGANNALAAGSRTLDVDRKPATDAGRPSANEPDLMDPSSLRPASPTPDSDNAAEVDDAVESM